MKYYLIKLNIKRKKPIQYEDYDTLVEQLESTLWNEAEISLTGHQLIDLN